MAKGHVEIARGGNYIARPIELYRLTRNPEAMAADSAMCLRATQRRSSAISTME